MRCFELRAQRYWCTNPTTALLEGRAARRARGASSAHGEVLTTAAVVLAIDKVFGRPALGAESSSSSLISPGTVRRALNVLEPARFFCSVLAQRFAIGPCPSFRTSPLPCSLPGPMFVEMYF